MQPGGGVDLVGVPSQFGVTVGLVMPVRSVLSALPQQLQLLSVRVIRRFT